MTERRPYSRHALTALKGRVKLPGLTTIDRRTLAARTLLAWRDDLAAELGGEETMSARNRALLDLATRTMLLVDSVDVWLMEQSTLVNKRSRRLLPVVRERQLQADSLVRQLGALGQDGARAGRRLRVEQLYELADQIAIGVVRHAIAHSGRRGARRFRCWDGRRAEFPP